MSSTDSQPALVLVTGSTGYVGVSIVLEFLRAGFRVRQAVRKQAQAAAFDKKYPEFSGRTSYFLITSLDAPGAFDEAVKGVTYIAHAASPVNYMFAEDCKRDIIDPAIEGAVGILRSAKSEPSVKAVVLTSSLSAFLDLFNPPGPETRITSDDWNQITYDIAIKLPSTEGVAAYSHAERAAWDFMEKEKPGFTLTVYVQCILIDATHQAWPPGIIPSFVDVRDVAKAHVAAVTRPEAAGKRYICSAGQFSCPEAMRFCVKRCPTQSHRFPSAEGAPFEPIFQDDGAKCASDLCFTYMDLETSVGDWAAQVFSLPEEKPIRAKL
ncbi:hypothetical protein RQP46_006750 [Phenoliferia psychrophenolica]